MTKDQKDNLIGKKLGQYKLIEVAGKGSLATVYKARQLNLERWVAVKVLDTDNRKMLARFEQEAIAVARLRHHNILVVYEYDRDHGWPYIAMEFVEQGTLKDYLAEEPFDWHQATQIAMAIAAALQHAHRYGLIHRDVKPSNILMRQDDWPLLADFGLVKMMERPDKETITTTPIIIGTPEYIPPEQANLQTVDSRADIYSLGVVLFEMVTGRLPFQYKDANFMLEAHTSEPPPSPRNFNLDCPLALEEVILTALQKSPADRYPDMQAMLAALQVVADIPFPKTRPLPKLSGQIEPKLVEKRAKQAQILLRDYNKTIDLPDPGVNEGGLILGRKHSTGRVDVDLSPYGAAEHGVSRVHARLTRQDGDWLIEDLGSTNGIYINRKKIKPGTPMRLNHNDLVHCSHLPFVFLLPSETSG